jgi:stage IV sporulation protein B
MKKKIIALSSVFVIFVTYFFINYFIENKKENMLVSGTINKKINPIGRLVGLKMYTRGVLVIGMSEIDGADGKTYKPYEGTDIKEGDFIRKINGVEINNTDELTTIVNSSNGNEIEITAEKEETTYTCKIKPVKTRDGNYMLGLWIRDAACGIGTLTYYDKSTKSFGTLGHGLIDVDTGKILNIKNGEIVTSKIVSIVKAEKDKTGEIRGIIDDGIVIGNIEKNSKIGVYGKIANENYINEISLPEVSVASRKEIKEGKAKIICQLENDEEPKEYNIEIKKVYKSNSKNNKSMLIKVTDKNLIDKTGGIIPGMSGTPIIQNGKFIGAITNVLVKNPEYGYAIFADLMLQ